MEFLQHLDGPYAVIGLIVFVAASALGVRSRSAANKGPASQAPLFFGLALAGLATTAGVAWVDMQKTRPATSPETAGSTISATDGSNVVTGVESSGSGSISINQGGQAP